MVAADASTVRLGLRVSHVKRAALAEQMLFGLFLPGPDLMLARLSPTDLLLLDRGYPCRWSVALLNHRATRFCMRVDQSEAGFGCVREFVPKGESERIVMLRAPDKQDALDCECPRKPQRVRLVRHVAPNGEQRVLMTNLFDEKRHPASSFGELYHQRWSIEGAFKRLKHRLNLEHVTGLSQQASDPGRRGQDRLRQPAGVDRLYRSCRCRIAR